MAVDRLPDEEAIYVTLAEMKEVSRRSYQAVGNLPGRNLQPSYSSSPRTPPQGMQLSHAQGKDVLLGHIRPDLSMFEDVKKEAAATATTVDLSYADFGVIQITVGTPTPPATAGV